MNYNCWRGYYWSMLIYLLTFDANIFKHFGEVTFTIGAFLTREDLALGISLHSILFSEFIIEKAYHVLVVHRS